MAWKKIDDTLLTSIADAIRSKSGSTDEMHLEEMAERIAEISGGFVQTKEGNFVTGSEGSGYVDVGFIPDALYIKSSYKQNIWTTEVVAFIFYSAELTKPEQPDMMFIGNTGYLNDGRKIYLVVSNTFKNNSNKDKNGFYYEAYFDNRDGEEAAGVQLEYVAIKFDGNVEPGEITPSGTKEITSNGLHDVTSYAYANVNVPNSGDEQAAPTISVSASGLITATAGDKSTIYQLPTKEIAMITPTASNQTIKAPVYLIGNQIIKGDANLKAENIKSGISIFGVAGSFAGSGGSDETKYNVSVKNSSSFEYTVCAGGSIVLIPTGQTKVVSVPIRSPIVAYDASYNNYPAGQIVGTGGITISGCFAFLNTAPSGAVSIDIEE